MPVNVPARSILTQLWCLCPFGGGIRTMRVSESLIRIDGLGNPHTQFLRMTHPKEQGGDDSVLQYCCVFPYLVQSFHERFIVCSLAHVVS